MELNVVVGYSSADLVKRMLQPGDPTCPLLGSRRGTCGTCQGPPLSLFFLLFYSLGGLSR